MVVLIVDHIGRYRIRIGVQCSRYQLELGVARLNLSASPVFNEIIGQCRRRKVLVGCLIAFNFTCKNYSDRMS